MFVNETMEGKPWHPPLVWPPRGKVELTSSGDCAAFHAGWAIGSPVARCGICARCCAPKNEWINEDAIKKARKRSFVTQCVANHINPFKFLPGFEDKDAPKCFHCGKTVDDALEAAEHAEMENASPSGRLQLTADHIKSHAGGLRGWRPNFPMDNRRRSRGLLHRRMNVVSNCIAATILRVTFDPAKRVAANAHLDKHKMLWKMPERPSQRAKTISAGNDARRFVTDPAILKGLLDIFWDDASRAAAEAEIEKLQAATAANEECRSEGPAPKPRAKPRAPAAKVNKGGLSRKSPIGVASNGVGAKKATGKKGSKGKGKQVHGGAGAHRGRQVRDDAANQGVRSQAQARSCRLGCSGRGPERRRRCCSCQRHSGGRGRRCHATNGGQRS